MSEFGKGLTYCLGLFLAHAERFESYKQTNKELREKTGKKDMFNTEVSTWFNGASDHLYDLQIPDNLPKNIKKRLKKLQNRALEIGHGTDWCNSNLKDDEVRLALNEAKTLLRLIDKFNGIETSKGGWE